MARVSAPVSPVLEISAIAARESASQAAREPSEGAKRNDPLHWDRGGRALLFESVDGSNIPVLINTLGSYRRMEMAIGCHEAGHTPGGFDALAAKIGALTKPEPPSSIGDLVRKAKQFAPILRVPPKTARSGACQQVVITGSDVDLSMLPLIKCWPQDGDLASVGYPASVNRGIPGSNLSQDPAFRGRYITFAGIHTIHADDEGATRPSSHNIGMYRVQLVGRKRLAMHWHMHHDGARHWRSWKAKGKPMPIAIAFGGESVLPFSAIAPMPPGISELLFAGFLNRKGIPMVRCRTVPLRVPANAEVVIEGWVSPEAGGPGFDPRDPDAGALGDGAYFEGPFGDHTGFYSLPDRYPLVDVSAITMRRDPIFPATVVGPPPQEDYPMGKAVERLFLPLLKTIVHDVADYDLPMFGAFHNCAVIQVKKEYPLQARRLMHSVWGAGQMAWTKCVIVVDDDVDVHDHRAVLRAVSEHCDPRFDIERTAGPLDILDHAAPTLGGGGKIGFDATRPWAAERPDGRLHGLRGGKSTDVSASAKEIAGVRDARAIPGAPGWLLVRVNEATSKTQRERLSKVLEACDGSGVRFVVGVCVDLADDEYALFHWCANFDPSRDSIEADGRIAFDATPKRAGSVIEGRAVRDWPPYLAMTPEVSALIERRWAGYGLDHSAMSS